MTAPVANLALSRPGASGIEIWRDPYGHGWGWRRYVDGVLIDGAAERSLLAAVEAAYHAQSHQILRGALNRRDERVRQRRFAAMTPTRPPESLDAAR